MKSAKSILVSKTFWANAIAMVAAVSVMLGVDLGLDAERQAQILASIMPIVNIALRLVTKEPVKLK